MGQPDRSNAALIWRSLENSQGSLKAIPRLATRSSWCLFGGVGVFAEYWTIVGRDAGLALLTVMTSLKFLESRNHRDMLILIFLCYFLIATHFLFSQSILTAALMLLTLVIITTTLVTLNQRNEYDSYRNRFKIGARLIGLSIPLMLILFILVPRIPGPIWGITNEQRGGITGLSDHMSPGDISNLIQSNEVAFRVEFEGKIPSQSQLYWRGPVMALFSGRRWYQSRRHRLDSFNLELSNEPIDYTVTLEPNGERWLLALDMPTRVIADSVMTSDYQLTSKLPINDLRRYDMRSYTTYRVGLDEDPSYLQLTQTYPDSGNPRTIALGKKLAAQFPDKVDIVNEVLKMFRTEEYVYTLQPPLLRGDVVDEFLFETRRGFCEHYAGSFALLMRAAGIPSRIVAGYQGGEYNDVGKYLIVRQSDAHAWTEVWLDDRGWIRVDPTAAVSPSRIEQGIDNALPEETANFRIQNRNPLFGNLLYSWDNLQHSWNDWVLNYDDQKQRNFLRDLNVGISSWGDMVIALVGMLFSVTGFYWFLSWYRERPPKPEQVEIHFQKFLKKMEKSGFIRQPSEDARDFLHRAVKEGFDKNNEASKIINLYLDIKYGKANEAGLLLNNFKSSIQNFSA